MNFGERVLSHRAAGSLVVQPRMGFAEPRRMRAALIATRRARATTVGTITLDSFTRLGDFASARSALDAGEGLNGYPIVSHAEAVTRSVLDGVLSDEFPVQVRHGSPQPLPIVERMFQVGLHATEGGPVSYCLPYSRAPLEVSLRNWRACCEACRRARDLGVEPHLETFGGCMMGQLCPPSLLVALSVLEALFFHDSGIDSLSVSYAQQTNLEQDQQAIRALRRLCAELLPGASWHVVVYTYMGLAPRSAEGAQALLERSVELAVSTGSERLIVKTVAEAYRVPTVAENVAALELAATASVTHQTRPAPIEDDGEIYQEARAMIEAVLTEDDDVGRALVTAFKRGLLDVPYCLHPDNAGRTRACLDGEGRLRWADVGALPLAGIVDSGRLPATTAEGLMQALSYVQRTFDAVAVTGAHATEALS